MAGKYEPYPYCAAQEVRRDKIRELVEALDAELMTLPNCRQAAISITKLEECHMWAEKAVREIQFVPQK